jgi:hypothetical protein
MTTNGRRATNKSRLRRIDCLEDRVNQELFARVFERYFSRFSRNLTKRRRWCCVWLTRRKTGWCCLYYCYEIWFLKGQRLRCICCDMIDDGCASTGTFKLVHRGAFHFWEFIRHVMRQVPPGTFLISYWQSSDMRFSTMHLTPPTQPSLGVILLWLGCIISFQPPFPHALMWPWKT